MIRILLNLPYFHLGLWCLIPLSYIYTYIYVNEKYFWIKILIVYTIAGVFYYRAYLLVIKQAMIQATCVFQVLPWTRLCLQTEDTLIPVNPPSTLLWGVLVEYVLFSVKY